LKQAVWEPLEPLDPLVPLDLLDLLGLQDQLVPQDQPETPDHPDPLGQLDLLDLQAIQVHLDPLDLQDQLDHRVFLERPVKIQLLKERQVQLALLVP